MEKATKERQTSQLKPKNIQPQLMTNNLKQAAYQSQEFDFSRMKGLTE